MKPSIVALVISSFVMVLFLAATSNGRNAADDDAAAVKSWAAFTSQLDKKLEGLQEKWRTKPPHPHTYGSLEVIQTDLVHSALLAHPVIGVIEIQANTTDDKTITKTLGGGVSTSQNDSRVATFQLRFVPENGKWRLLDGTATLVWAVDDSFFHPGMRARYGVADTGFCGGNLVSQLLEE